MFPVNKVMGAPPLVDFTKGRGRLGWILLVVGLRQCRPVSRTVVLTFKLVRLCFDLLRKVSAFFFVFWIL